MEGRLKFIKLAHYPSVFNDVRLGRKVIVEFDLVTNSYNSKHFSLKGKYLSSALGDIYVLCILVSIDRENINIILPSVIT